MLYPLSYGGGAANILSRCDGVVARLRRWPDPRVSPGEAVHIDGSAGTDRARDGTQVPRSGPQMLDLG